MSDLNLANKSLLCPWPTQVSTYFFEIIPLFSDEIKIQILHNESKLLHLLCSSAPSTIGLKPGRRGE